MEVPEEDIYEDESFELGSVTKMEMLERGRERDNLERESWNELSQFERWREKETETECSGNECK